MAVGNDRPDDRVFVLHAGGNSRRARRVAAALRGSPGGWGTPLCFDVRRVTKLGRLAGVLAIADVDVLLVDIAAIDSADTLAHSVGCSKRGRPPAIVGLAAHAREMAFAQTLGLMLADCLLDAEIGASGLQRAIRNAMLRDASTGLRPRADESEQRLAGLVDSAMDAIVTIDEDLRIVLFNAAAETMFGWPAREMLGESIDRLIPERFRAAHREHVARFAESGRTMRRMSALGTIDARRSDGTEFPAEASISQVVVSGKRLLTVIIRDVSERVRAEHELRQANALLELRVAERTAQLEAANRELEKFNYSVSHDLRAPLRAIDGFAMRLETHGAQLDADARRYLDRIRAASRDMAALIDDLLDYARLGRAGIHAEPVRLDEVFDLVLRQLSERVERSRARVELRRDLPTVQGQRSLLTQIFANLIDNALKFVRPGERPDVAVHATNDGHVCVVTVTDKGIGVDPRYATQIFTPFERIHTRDQYPGTGVGLAVVRRAAELLGGRVWTATHGGPGAEFYVQLPLAKTPIGAAPSPTTATPE